VATLHVQPGPLLYIFKLNAILNVDSELFREFVREDFSSPDPEWAGSAQGEGYETHWDDGDPEMFITRTDCYTLAARGAAVLGG